MNSIYILANQNFSLGVMKNKSLRLLMAEDNEINRKLAEIIFAKSSLSLDFAFDGLEAVEKSLANAYDIIFMDVEMPRLDGIEASQQIKEALKEKAPLIIGLTAHSEEEYEEFINQGFDECMAKPIRLSDLEQIINKYKL